MPTGIGAANPKFSKSGRKPKKTRHCTNLKNSWQVKEKQKGDFSLKYARLRIGNMIHQGQVWGNIFSDISRKKKDEGWRQRYTLEEWNLGKCLA